MNLFDNGRGRRKWKRALDFLSHMWVTITTVFAFYLGDKYNLHLWPRVNSFIHSTNTGCLLCVHKTMSEIRHETWSHGIRLCYVSRKQWFSTRQIFPSVNVRRKVSCHNWVSLASNGLRPGILLSLHRAQEGPTTKNSLTVEKPCYKGRDKDEIIHH